MSNVFLIGLPFDLSDLIGDFFSAPARKLLKIGFKGYNRLLSFAMELLMTSPDKWMDGEGWKAVKTFEDSFIVIGSLLATIFWLIHYVTEMTDIKSQMRLESDLKLLIKILITDALIAGSFKLVRTLYSIVDYITAGQKMSVKDYKMSVPDELDTALSNLSPALSVVFIPIAAIFMIVMFVAGVIMVYMIFIRHFKLLAAAPYAILASATVAGNREISRTAYSYWKNLIATILSAVTMLIGLKISSLVISSGVVDLMKDTDDGIIYIMMYLLQTVLIVLFTAGFLKLSDDFTKRLLGV